MPESVTTRLRERCQLQDIWAPHFVIKTTQAALHASATACDFCRLLSRTAARHQDDSTRAVRFYRIRSEFRLEESGPAVLQICTGPGNLLLGPLLVTHTDPIQHVTKCHQKFWWAFPICLNLGASARSHCYDSGSISVTLLQRITASQARQYHCRLVSSTLEVLTIRV